MTVPFRKMHGCGNDFLIVDARRTPVGFTPARIAALADRRTGVGFDQLITLERPRNGADVYMRIDNADGGEAGACGNATRCVAALLAAETGRGRLMIETVSGDLIAEHRTDGRIAVDMGRPGLSWRDVPLAHEVDTLTLSLPGEPAACSMGNPHATLFVADIASSPIETLGAALEHDPLFPERVNVGFAQVIAPDRIRLRVWERGAGLTRACGSGACAALVNAHRRGLASRSATVVLDGGELQIDWREGGVLMTGPVAHVFTGVLASD